MRPAQARGILLCGLTLGLGLSLCSPALSAPPAAARAAPAPNEPVLTLEVSPRDTLIGLSQQLLVTPRSWPEIAKLNRLANPHRIQPGQVLVLPLRLLRSTEVPAQLETVEGEVVVDDQPARTGMPLRPGQRLRTGAAGSAVLRLGDGSRVQVVPGSEARLDEHRQFGAAPAAETPGNTAASWFASAMRLVSGSVEILASKVMRAKPLEVSTPTAVIGVRGTEYRIHHEPLLSEAPEPPTAITRTEVLSGRVQADPLGQRQAGVLVSAGQGAALQAGRPPQIAPLLPAPDLSAVPERFERPLIRLALPHDSHTLRLQVAADAGFERLVRDDRVPAGEPLRIAGLEDGRWYLRLREVDALGIEGLNASQAFTLKARPEPPVAAAPRPGAKQSVGTVALAWAENVEAAEYRVQVARGADFSEVLLSQDGVRGAGTSLSLNEPGAYFWRTASVKADGDLGPWGDARAFELRPLPSPPQGGLSADGQGLELNWTGQAGDLQQVELARDANFTQVVAQADLTQARWTLPLPGQPGDYFFRYRSVEPDGFTSPWSSTLKVEVPRDWGFLWMLAPLLLSL